MGGDTKRVTELDRGGRGTCRGSEEGGIIPYYVGHDCMSAAGRRGRHCGCAGAQSGEWGGGKRRTEVVYGVVGGHALSYACEDVERWMRVEERATEVGEVRDKYAWVELSLEEAETGVLEACLEQALEADPLVDVR